MILPEPSEAAAMLALMALLRKAGGQFELTREDCQFLSREEQSFTIESLPNGNLMVRLVTAEPEMRVSECTCLGKPHRISCPLGWEKYVAIRNDDFQRNSAGRGDSGR